MMTAFAVIRIAHYASLMIAFGGESLRALFRAYLPRPPESRVPRRLTVTAAIVSFVTAGLWFIATTAQVFDSWGAAFDPHALALVATQTSFGPVLVVRIALCLILAATAFYERARLLRVFVSGLALAAIAVTSHAAASGESFKAARVLVDAVHLLAAGFWVGALVELVPLALSERKSANSLIEPLQIFSSVGIVAVTALVAAGALNGVLILYANPSEWAPAYLTLLAIKLVLAGIMIALALANRFTLMPGVNLGDADAARNLVGSIVAELAFGLTIVAIVGFLGIMAPLKG